LKSFGAGVHRSTGFSLGSSTANDKVCSWKVFAKVYNMLWNAKMFLARCMEDRIQKSEFRSQESEVAGAQELNATKGDGVAFQRPKGRSSILQLLQLLTPDF